MDDLEFKDLAHAAFTYPAIDNHTHPLLKQAHRNDFAFEGLLSEATGDALTEDAIHTLSCYRATKQLADLYECENEWEAVKAKRSALSYEVLCKTCLSATGIQCLLIDDGLDANGICEDISWHDQFTSAPSRRILRIEIVAQVILFLSLFITHLFDSKTVLQDILKGQMPQYLPITITTASSLLSRFSSLFDNELQKAAEDPFVVGFKSIACYRTGLDVSPTASSLQDLEESLMGAMARFQNTKRLRLADKPFNDYLVRLTMEIASKCKKPGTTSNLFSFTILIRSISPVSHRSRRQRAISSKSLASTSSAANHSLSRHTCGAPP